MVDPYNDKPISQPTEDRFSINPFAKTLAASIRKLSAPEGTVLALNGAWGSGKSSAVNLVLYHLKEAVDAGEVTVINFNCWWFRGEEALALAFFRELYAGLGPTLGERFKKALPKLGGRLLRGGAMVGAGIDLAGMGAGPLASGAMTWLSALIQDDDTVEKLHSDLTKMLADQKQRFLIVIDDIDRLAPDEALLIFRLLKSVGRLPNVMYLLVFDRLLAEAIVAEKYPSEGPHYLEKIIQASFDIPEPRQSDLVRQLLAQIELVCGSPGEADIVRFMNVFYDVVAPEIRTPRDLVRLMNALSVSWPAVGPEVDRADFVAIETLRILQPAIYRTIRANKDRLCGTSDRNDSRTGEKQRAEYDLMLFGSSDAADGARKRRALMRLFPRLEAVWQNMHYTGSSAAAWARQRLICAEVHFDSYFRFSIGDEILPRKEIDELIRQASDVDFVTKTLRDALDVRRADGSTKAALILDELNLHADKVSDDDVRPLLAAVFSVGDELNVDADKAKAFSIGSNQLRIHWLLRRLVLERFDLAKRSAVFMAAAEGAPVGWLVDFAESAHGDYHPRKGEEPEREDKCLTTSDDADRLRRMALNKIRDAARSGELGDHKELPHLLFSWREMAGDDGAEVKAWLDGQLAHDERVVALAKAFTTYSWSQGMGMSGLGDMVARRSTRAGVSKLEWIMDKARFRSRVEELALKPNLPTANAEIIRTFLDAWKRNDMNPRH